MRSDFVLYSQCQAVPHGPGLRKARHQGPAKVGWLFTFAMAAYNLVRLPRLLGSAAA